MADDGKFVELANNMLLDAITKSKSYKEVEIAIELGAALNVYFPVQIKNGEVEVSRNLPPLLIALTIPDIDHRIIKVMLDQGADPTFDPGFLEAGPIHYAAYKGSPRALQLIVSEQGVNLNEPDVQGSTPLVNTIEGNRSLNMSVLLEAGADPNRGGGGAKIFPVIEATKKGRDGMLAILFEYGTNPNVSDSEGYAALHYAAQLDNDIIARMLIRHGAELDIRGANMDTPLIYAMQKGSNNVAKTLIDAGADIHATDNLGMNATVYAIKTNNYEIFNYIMEKHPELKSAKGEWDDLVSMVNAGGNRHLISLLRDSESKQVQVTPEQKKKVTGM